MAEPAITLADARALLDEHAPCERKDCGALWAGRRPHCHGCDDWLNALDDPCEVNRLAAAYCALAATADRVAMTLTDYDNSDEAVVALGEELRAALPKEER